MMVQDNGLLIDNSNTRTKFALISGGKIGVIRVLPTAELAAENILQLVEDWHFDRVCLCSVVPAAAQTIQSAFVEYSVYVLRASAAGIVDFSSYEGIETLGADRVANALAAARYAACPLVAVDMGTATTFDVVLPGADKPVFAGGIITPGYHLFSQCLSSGTALLPEVAWNDRGPYVGRTTREAIAAGVCLGYAGMLDSLIDGIEKELGRAVTPVFTGGDAQRFVPLMRHSGKIVTELTLQGLALAAGYSL